MRAKVLLKLMQASGLRRITPEMTAMFSWWEVVALGMRGFFTIAGGFVAALSIVGVMVLSGQLIRDFVPQDPLRSLEEIAGIEHDAPVDVSLRVDFEEGIKVWKVKGRYFVAPVEGHEDRLFFFRSESHLEGEGTETPIAVKGWAATRGALGWDLPTPTGDMESRFQSAGKTLPKDAVIIYEDEAPSVGLKIWRVIVFLLMAWVVTVLVRRVLDTVKLLRSRESLAAELNRLAGLPEEAEPPPPLPGDRR